MQPDTQDQQPHEGSMAMPPAQTDDPNNAEPQNTPKEQPASNKTELKKPQLPQKPVDNSIRTAIIATVVIVVVLACLAVYAYSAK